MLAFKTRSGKRETTRQPVSLVGSLCPPSKLTYHQKGLGLEERLFFVIKPVNMQFYYSHLTKKKEEILKFGLKVRIF